MESAVTPFLSSLFILLREGFEAMLIAILVFMYLDKVQARDKRPAVVWGIIAGIVASLFIALGFKKIVGLTSAHEELFEGGVMIIATGNSFVLGFTVFLAILREGFEVVLFYGALIGSGIYNTVPVFTGAFVGAIALVAVYFGLNKVTKIIPIGMFFRASSVLLALLAVYFAYEGIHEFGEGIEALKV